MTSILIAMLLPALSKAGRIGKNMLCSSNLRQIAQMPNILWLGSTRSFPQNCMNNINVSFPVSNGAWTLNALGGRSFGSASAHPVISDSMGIDPAKDGNAIEFYGVTSNSHKCFESNAVYADGNLKRWTFRENYRRAKETRKAYVVQELWGMESYTALDL